MVEPLSAATLSAEVSSPKALSTETLSTETFDTRERPAPPRQVPITRRLRALPVTPEALEAIAGADPATTRLVEGDLPEDARPIGLYFEYLPNEYRLVLQSTAFDEAGENRVIPCLESLPRFQRHTPAPGCLPEFPPCPFVAALRDFVAAARASVRAPNPGLENVVIFPAYYRAAAPSEDRTRASNERQP